MIAARLGVAAALLLLAGAGAQASDAADVAARGGFLLGQALRCGIPEPRLEIPARRLHDLVAALAASADEQHEADRGFAARLLASTHPRNGEPLPSCAFVGRKLVQFERHLAAMPVPQAETAKPPLPPKSAFIPPGGNSL